MTLRTPSLMVVALALAGSARGQPLRVSPGPLTRAHASLDGVTSCDRCHEAGRGVSAAKCLACHAPIAARIAARKGVHRAVSPACTTCHREHRGVDADLRRLDVPSFNHLAETGFPSTCCSIPPRSITAARRASSSPRRCAAPVRGSWTNAARRSWTATIPSGRTSRRATWSHAASTPRSSGAACRTSTSTCARTSRRSASAPSFPACQGCLEYGIDVTRDLLPVVPAAHYSCGGVWVDEHGRSTIERLYAVGEVSCTGLHGANRLASTSLLEGLVWGHRSAQHIAAELRSHDGPRYEDIPPWQPTGREVPDPALIAQDVGSIKHIMWTYVGLVRPTPRLARAIQDLRNLEVG